MNGGPADWRQPYEARAIKSEMLGPKIKARVKQADELPRIGVKAGDVRTFEAIAVEASQRKVLYRCGSSMLSSNNVIDLKR